MKKLVMAMLMALCLVLPGHPGIARAAEQGWIYDPSAKTLTSGTTVLKNVSAEGDKLTIGDNSNSAFTELNLTTPITDATDSSYSIQAIGYPGFRGSSKLASILLPNTLKEMSSFALSECSALGGITIPESVTKIESYTFQRNPKLATISLPNSLRSIGEGAFQYCSALATLHIPSSVSSIGQSAFYNCTSLESITLPKKLKAIKSNLFYGCSSLKTISLPNSLISIGDYAFKDCSTLTQINIPSDARLIGSSAFNGCKQLSAISIPEGVSTIEEFTFYDCSSLRDIALPNSIASIEYGAFGGCSSLVSISLPEGLENIGGWAFSKCTSLQSIEIPQSVSSIGEFAFHQCTSLETANLPDGLTVVSKGIFMHCNKLQSIEIPHGVTEIGQSAFSGCWRFKSLSIPSTVKRIGDRAFWSCSNNRQISILATIPPASPGNDTFYNTPYLGAIIVPAKSLEAYKAAKDWGGSLRPNILKAGFTVTVDGDEGRDLHLSGSPVTIEASAKDACHPFDRWSITGIDVADATANPLTFTMPERDVTAESVYTERHAWGEPEWAWSEDGRSCEATFTCANDPSHVEAAEAEVTSSVKTPATCTESGVTEYTATVEHEGETFTATAERADIPRTGHTWGEPEWAWSEDGRSCEATFTCANDPSHVETAEAEVTSSAKTPATCTEDGVTEYTATVEREGETFTATAERADIPATGHTFENGVCTECGVKDPNFKPEEKPEIPGGGSGDNSESGTPQTPDPEVTPGDNQGPVNPGTGQPDDPHSQGDTGQQDHQTDQGSPNTDQDHTATGEVLAQTGDPSLAFAAASCLGALTTAAGLAMRRRTR